MCSNFEDSKILPVSSHITQSGTYFCDNTINNIPEKIYISSDVCACFIFLGGSGHDPIHVFLKSKTKLDFLGIYIQNSENIFFHQDKESTLTGQFFGFTGCEKKITITSQSIIQGKQGKCDVVMTNFCKGGHVFCEGNIHITQKGTEAKVSLQQNNIFLGDKGEVRGFPRLNVEHNNIQARHGASIDRVSQEKLFYLRSRGMSCDDATRLMIEGRVLAGLTRLSSLPLHLTKQLAQMMLENVFSSLPSKITTLAFLFLFPK